MKIKTPEEKKKDQKMIIILIVIVLITLIFLYFTVWSKKSGTENVSVNNTSEGMTPEEMVGMVNNNPGEEVPLKKQLSPSALEEKLKTVKLNIDFFNQKILPFLKQHGDLPVEKGESGKNNPFTP